LLTLFFAFVPCTFAQNLVTNGGFETGDFTGWTQFGDTSFTGVCPDGDPSTACSGYTPHSGAWMGSFGAIHTQGGVTQDLSTIAGATYQISFYLSNGQSPPNSFSVSFDGVTLISGTNVGYLHWQLFQFTQVASSNTAALTFAFYQVPDYYDLDDVSVELVNTPEPGPLALVGGAVVLGILKRRLLQHLLS
jgi:hypothetical protein